VRIWGEEGEGRRKRGGGRREGGGRRRRRRRREGDGCFTFANWLVTRCLHD